MDSRRPRMARPIALSRFGRMPCKILIAWNLGPPRCHDTILNQNEKDQAVFVILWLLAVFSSEYQRVPLNRPRATACML
jgi:hypothetical protein